MRGINISRRQTLGMVIAAVLVIGAVVAYFVKPSLHALVTITSQFSEYPTTAGCGSQSAITTSTDGTIWFADIPCNKIGKITTAGVITEYSIPTVASKPWGIADDKKGNMWFTEQQGNKIGMITAAGVITEYPILPVGTSVLPEGIALGPDGNMWFTEYANSKIGMITPAGVITHYMAAPGSGPSSIAAGPDKYMWFTEYTGNFIGKISPVDYSINYFPLPTANAYVSSIVAGPDNYMWFTEAMGNKIGKIAGDFTGKVTEYPVSTANAGLLHITVGPDKNLWFTENGANKIGMITTAGAITEYPQSFGRLPQTPLSPLDITSGPDGNIWFSTSYSSTTTNYIGKQTIITLPVISSVTFAPATGTLLIGQTLTMTIHADGSNYTAGTITVNGVATTDFTHLTGNDYSVVYTVAAGNNDIAAGTVIPVSVELLGPSGTSSGSFITSPLATASPAIDANAPTISAGASKTIYANGKATLAGTVTGQTALTWSSDSSVKFTFAGDDSSSPTPTVTSATPGVHIITMTATDSSGNKSTSTTTLIVYKNGDINNDGNVDVNDFTLLMFNWGTPTNPMADLDGDGVVNDNDFTVLMFWWGK